MRLLLDSCVARGALEVLSGGGHDAVTVAQRFGDDPGDSAILALAHSEDRVVVTLDKDFGELVVVRGAAHSGILRLVGFSSREHGAAVLDALARVGEALGAGALVTVEPDRIRVRGPV